MDGVVDQDSQNKFIQSVKQTQFSFNFVYSRQIFKKKNVTLLFDVTFSVAYIIIFLAGCMCPCNMVHTPKNFTDEELTKNIEEMKKKLAVNKQQLSSSIRKKISVKDDRPSAKAVGSVGVVILAVCFGLLIALDYVTLTRHILGLLRVIRNLFLRN